MRRSTKIWLITASLLVVFGTAVFAFPMAKYNWDITKLTTNKYETNIYEIEENFTDLSVNTDTADIIFTLADDGKCKVECYEEEKTKHHVAVENNTLVIKMTDNRAFYDHIGINFDSPKITVYLPEKQYNLLCIDESTGDINVPNGLNFKDVSITASTGDIEFFAGSSDSIRIKTSTGDIKLENILSKTVDLSASTGDITLSNVDCEEVNISVTTGKVKTKNVKCENFTSEGSTGDIVLEGVISGGKLSVERSTGDVTFEGSDAGEILVKTSTGDVKGTLITDKVFVVQTDTGTVDVPETTNGGKCKIITDTGDVRIKIQGKET